MELPLDLLEHIYRATAIPVRYFDSTKNITLYCSGFETSPDPFDINPQILNDLLLKFGASTKPMLEFEERVFLYGVINDINDCKVIVGPVLLGDSDSTKISEYAKRHKIDPVPLIRPCYLNRFISIIALIHFIRNKELIHGYDILANLQVKQLDTPVNPAYQSYVMDNVEREVRHLSYAYEKEYMRQIREGDTESIGNNFINTKDMDISSIEERVGRVAKNKGL